MIVGVGIISFWDLAGAAISLAPVVLFLALTVHSAQRSSIEAIARYLRAAKWFLITALFFVLLVTIASYTFGKWQMELRSFFVYAFVELPLFFTFAYFMGALWISVLLHMVIRRYHHEGRSVENACDSQAVRKAVASFRWLHVAMLLGSRSRLREMLDQICPPGHR